MKKSLNGRWEFQRAGSGTWKSAIVPGCNFLDLMRNGDIDDPFVALNEKKMQWIGEVDWVYKRHFYINTREYYSDDVLIHCKMLDTLCDVYINNRRVFSGNNCFVLYCHTIKKFLHIGENEIKIYFHSPVKYVREMYKKCPTPINSNGQNGIVHIRKPQYHFGWDWGPVLVPSGITGDIELEFVKAGRIRDLQIKQTLGNDGARIKANLSVKEHKKIDSRITLICPDGKEVVGWGKNIEFAVDNPEFWWTYELSGKQKQPLYTVRAELLVGDKIVDSLEKRIGIRTIELNRDKDFWGQNFQFKLNGVPLFIKGANYIPPDSFINRFTKKKLNYLLDAVQFSNMNMLRVWGGGYYGSDEFYDACDERGILVWQDFPFACQAYPFFDNKFLNNVKKEISQNVKRINHHPSLALWNGNNEIEDMHMAWVHMTKYVNWTEKFFYNILEPEIRECDTDTPYTPGSPIGISHNNGMGADNVGDTHLWGVWHGLQPMNYYRKRMTRFCSEFGFESLPDLKTIEMFAKSYDCDFDSEVLKAHQKCANGNDKMIYYIASRFNLPKRFGDYVYLSQVTQLECIADATEHWRRNKGRCNGSMYWQLNDCWGACSWSSLDYYGNYKALQYGAKHFNAPLSVSIEDTEEYIKIFALSDLIEPQKVKVEYEVFDFENGTLEKKSRDITLPKLENREAFELDVSSLRVKYNYKKTGVAARLYQDGKLLMQKVVLFDKEKNINLPKAKLKTKIVITDKELSITVHTDKFARLVKVESSKSTRPFSDNFFDLLPNQSKTITIVTDKKYSLREVAESIKVYSLCNIEFDNDERKTKWKRFGVYLSPTNLANAAHHSKLSKDIKFE
ncbi:MAG: hypothetical protein NC397_10205 [Clostridium sp.]|nr:hypothetical protein [Clostridium sp.]